MAQEKPIHLYPYQADMVNRIEKAFESFRSVMVQMPTGTGKTHVIAAVTKSYISKGHAVFVIAHRRELVAQAENTLQLYIDDKDMKKVEVFSVQWLNRHVSEITSRPSLIVIDEAHHSVAKTYTSIIEAFPKAKIVGLTATPCRLNGHPFTDLFDVLLQSHPINWFIAKEYLSLYDYMSVKPDNEDVRIINNLRKRGADGDFSVREMSEKLDLRPSLERLCDTITRYAKGKKGIVYAIDIKHAEHIA
ncbi:MAG: DEAD/DEAH box helicase family protein, partial [Prevotella sp.]|nr:DEAD/DEAH box helicase family protein [Prevotella sp.]